MVEFSCLLENGADLTSKQDMRKYAEISTDRKCIRVEFKAFIKALKKLRVPTTKHLIIDVPTPAGYVVYEFSHLTPTEATFLTVD